MVIIISNPVSIADEHHIINNLFDEGLEVMHLRKPDHTITETAALLEKIDPNHYSKIALHQHHGLAEKFSLQRLHYTEERRKQKDHTLLKVNKSPKTLSTSIHQLSSYKNLESWFDYFFFGPVFDSISKPGYQSVIASDFRLPETSKVKIIALGGIDESKIGDIKNFGFAGIALLGAIWQSKNPVVQFKRIKEKWLKTDAVC